MVREHSTDRKKPSVPFSCLRHLLQHQAQRIPDAPAILAPGRVPLTYGRLYQHIDSMGRALRALGIGHRDRVAVVLPNGPEMAVATVSLAASAACAPMNPLYGVDELDRYFGALRPGALIVQAGIDSPARRVALARGVRVLELSSASEGEAGRFTLTGGHRVPASDGVVSPSDVALLLLTSGTTSLPKIVSLRHANICTSAYAHGAALALTETDRCLNVLPLFHGHGFIATVMASLAAGASVVCTPGFDVKSFFTWLAASQATWYSAVPTIHQAILAGARDKHEQMLQFRLRFVRSSSAPLSPRIFAELEQTFETPVIEWYGMGEVAASPIACNPLPPGRRKPGSVGVVVGLDVATMDEGGTLLPHGQTGQVVVRGASVMLGYHDNPAATDAAFEGDWLKTGDLGFFDDDGYLFLTGRIREIINRGGEKVAPQEVDDVLSMHPAVAEAVTFAVAHPTLGEDIVSAVVLRPDCVATPKDIRQFAIDRVAHFKTPSRVLIMTEIPKGPTGKTQRVGLAAKLGIASDVTSTRGFVTPRTPIENVLAEIWAEVLQIEQVGAHDDFFALGGDSLLATRVLIHLQEVMQIDVGFSCFFEAPTLAEMAAHIEAVIHAGQASRACSAIVRVPRENGIMPASLAQERLWKLQHALPDVPLFNIPYALRLTSRCDAAILGRCIDEIVQRHEILRTSFAMVDRRCVQVIAPQLTVPLEFDDLRPLPLLKQETIAHELVQQEVFHSFDLAKGPLIRVRLIRLAEQEHLFLVSMHQVICDGWSLGTFVEELAALYDALSGGEESPLAPLAIQYADFAHWQRDWQSHPEMVAQLEYWRAQLRDPLPARQLAKVGVRRTIDDLRTARREFLLPASLTEAARRFSHAEGGTLFMALVVAFKTLLHRYFGEDDVRVATEVANRKRPGSEALIGPLVNTVILRTDLGGDPSPREVMRRVRATALAAYARQDLPFQEVAQTLERDRRLDPWALASVMISLQNETLRPAAISGHGLSLVEANPKLLLPLVTVTSFDVILTLKESADGLAGTCVYKPHLFRAETVDRLLRDFQEVLERITMQPERPISAIHVSLNEQPSNA